MLVRVVREPCLPCGLSAIFDDRPEGLVIWAQQDAISEQTARMMEKLFNVAVHYWMRRAAGEQHLRAV